MKKLLVIALIALSFVFVGCNWKNTSVTGGAVVVDKVIERCEDSDGGVNTDVQGVVTIGDEDYTDECIEGVSVEGLLREYYCEGNNKANQNIERCPSKCSNGKCI